MVPVVLLDAPGGSYWRALDDFVHKHLLGGRMISPEDLHLYKLCDNFQTAIDEVLGFFRVYHSMRFVKQQLVIRLNEPLAPELLDAINENFRELLSSGQFVQQAALPLEHDDVELLTKPRLVFHFNRRAFGRLRLLIDVINRGRIE
jgi:hypothetical protein